MATDSNGETAGSSSPNPTVLAGLYRVVDAAINRASEGLRVVEDFARMALDDRHLTEQFKRLRHRLTEAIRIFDVQSLLAARDTEHDVGTELTLPSELERPNDARLIQANLGRAQQALRTLEEYSKSLSRSPSCFESLRYDCYRLEKALLTTILSRATLQRAELCVLVDCRSDGGAFESLVQQLIDGGVDLIQLRDDQNDDRQILDRGARLTRLLQGTDIRWIMNNRADLAVAAQADGVHLGQSDLPVRDARRIVGPHRLIGVSTHDLGQARQAALDGANYIGVGPVFDSQTKAFSALAGLDFVREVAVEIALPAFAIGGIDDTNVALVRQAGLHRVAVSAAICTAPDPCAAARALKFALQTDSFKGQKA